MQVGLVISSLNRSGPVLVHTYTLLVRRTRVCINDNLQQRHYLFRPPNISEKERLVKIRQSTDVEES